MNGAAAIALCNHASDVDWLLGWLLAQKCNILGVRCDCRSHTADVPRQLTRCLLKGVLFYVPFLGFSFYWSEYIFLTRSWSAAHGLEVWLMMRRASDQVKLKKSYKDIADTALPFWARHMHAMLTCITLCSW